MTIIYNKNTNEIITEITTNHSMSLDEAVNLAGEFIPMENIDDPNVLISGKEYWYDDLDLISFNTSEYECISIAAEQLDIPAGHLIAHYNDDEIMSVCTCRSGREALWIIWNDNDIAIYLDDHSILTEAEKEQELL